MKEMITLEELKQRAKSLRLHGIIAHWDEVHSQSWLAEMITWEEEERRRRSLERRIQQAHIGRFKPLADFDWSWPKRCDQKQFQSWMSLDFIRDKANLILVGPNGVGKTSLAQNVIHHAVLNGHTALFTTASEMLNDLSAQDGDRALKRRVQQYVRPEVLAIDELGYLSYSNRHADLLFEVVSRRYEEQPIIVTTNRPFVEWKEIFPNASCVVSMVDRLVHHAEIMIIEGDSWRAKEARERHAKNKTEKPE
jgi:DNA replication protein DnaC